MKTSRMHLALALCSLVLLLVTPVLAEDAHHPEKAGDKAAAPPAQTSPAMGSGMMGGGMKGGMMGSPYASLPPEKQEAVKAIDQTFQKKLTELKQKMWAKNAEIEAALSQPKPDRKKAAALNKELGELHTETQQVMIDRRLKIAEETGISMPMGMMGQGMGMMGPGMGGMMDMMGQGGMCEGMMEMMKTMMGGHGQTPAGKMSGGHAPAPPAGEPAKQ